LAGLVEIRTEVSPSREPGGREQRIWPECPEHGRPERFSGVNVSMRHGVTAGLRENAYRRRSWRSRESATPASEKLLAAMSIHNLAHNRSPLSTLSRRWRIADRAARLVRSASARRCHDQNQPSTKAAVFVWRGATRRPTGSYRGRGLFLPAHGDPLVSRRRCRRLRTCKPRSSTKRPAPPCAAPRRGVRISRDPCRAAPCAAGPAKSPARY